MQVFSARMDMKLNVAEPVLVTMTSFVSMVTMLEMKALILSGFKSKLEREHILEVVRKDGSVQTYRLTITLDSLAGSEKNANGSTTMGKPGKSIDANPTRTCKKGVKEDA